MQAWESFLKKQEQELGAETIDKWLRSLKVVHFDACNLYLEAKDTIQSLWFEEHMRPRVKGAFFNNNHHPIKIHLTVAEEYSQETLPIKKSKKKAAPLFTPHFPSDHLDPLATLDNFIPGQANQVPLTLLKEITQEQTPSFNPIYLYGASGVGKSHLLMGLAHAFKTKGAQVMFVRTETFTEHVVSAIRSGTMHEFRAAYRTADVLIMDDIHEFARRSATQEELFHTFNTLHTSRRQIILAGLKTPMDLEDIEQRLVSRFEWGISLRIQPLAPHEHILLLRKKLTLFDLSLSEEVQSFLISQFKSSSHALMRALETLILRASIPSPPLDKVELLLKDLIVQEQQQALHPSKIIHFVASRFGITTDDILGRTQTQECAFPRQIAMFLCREHLKLPYQKIGKLFTRDHSTVMTSIKAIQKKITAQDKEVLDIVKGFKSYVA